MVKKLESKKALYLESNRHTIPGRRRGKVQRGRGQWVEHKSDAALDDWGVAIRVLRKSGKSF